MRHFLWAICAFGLALAGCSGSSDEPVVRMSVASYNMPNLPFFIADSKGYFEEAGVKVRTENFAQGGSKVLQALVSGSTDVAVGFYDHTIQMQTKNKDVVAFVMLASNSGLVLAAGKNSKFDPTRPETIRGSKVGITAPGSSSDFFIRYYLQRNGISANDISLIGVGSGAAAVAALEQGNIDLLVNYDPAATMLETRKIGRILIDARSEGGAQAVYGGVYPASVLYAQRDFIAKHPEQIEKITRAMLKALTFIQDNDPQAIAGAVPPEYLAGDRKTYELAIQKAKAIFSKDGRFHPDDGKAPLAVLSAFNPDVRKTRIDLARTYTNEFVDRASAASGGAK